MKVPEEFHDLLLGKHVASVATLNPDGSPQVTPMWIDYDVRQNLFYVNTARGRKKLRNMEKNTKIAFNVIDSANSGRYIAVQGEITVITENGALDSINSLAKKYLGVDKYPFLANGEIRVKIVIKPVHVTTMSV